MLSLSRLRTIAIIAAVLTVFIIFGEASRADPPARIARLSTIDGAVVLCTGDTNSCAPAIVNYPIGSHTRIATRDAASAMISMGSTVIHLDANSDVVIDTLDDHRFQTTLRRGRLVMRIHSLPRSDRYIITTPQAIAQFRSIGLYRVTADDVGKPSEIAAFEGAATVADTNSTAWLVAGEAVLITGSAPGALRITPAGPAPRDATALTEAAQRRAPLDRRYVSPDMTGYEDLDANGVWAVEPGYGPVWYPTSLPADWAPYRDGHWLRVEPWGWTWMGDESWAFAPFHYGRWALVRDRWGWVPGDAAQRPVYAPALVAFLSDGDWRSRAAGDTGSPVIGWVPLAPRELYVPPYPTNLAYVREVNASNVPNAATITQEATQGAARGIYANRLFATVVAQSTIAAARPVVAAALTIPPAELAMAPVITGSMPPLAVESARTVAEPPVPVPETKPKMARLVPDKKKMAGPPAHRAKTPSSVAQTKVHGSRHEQIAGKSKLKPLHSSPATVAFEFTRTPDPHPLPPVPRIPVTRMVLESPPESAPGSR